MWVWGQRQGVLVTPMGKFAEYGHAGRLEGRNNPDMERVKGIGPLPCGLYTMQIPHNSPTTGPYTLTLIPDASNDMHGRSSFAIHGESTTDPENSSHGCIVVSREARVRAWESGDHRLMVIPL